MTVNWELLQAMCNNEEGGVMSKVMDALNMSNLDKKRSKTTIRKIVSDTFVEFATTQTHKKEKLKGVEVSEILIFTLLIEVVSIFIKKGAHSLNHIVNVMTESISLCESVEDRIKMATRAITSLHESHGFGNREINMFAHECNIIDKEKEKFYVEFDDKKHFGTMTIKNKKSGEIIMQGMFGAYNEKDPVTQAIKDSMKGVTGDA